MSIIKTVGIVIAESNYQDYDKMLTILTPSYGKISCIAKGSRRPNSKILSGSQLFAFCDFVFFKSKESYYLNQADIIEIFYDLRCDLDKLNQAVRLNKIVFANTYEHENSSNILMLYVYCLYHLSKQKDDTNYNLIEAIFKLRMIKYLGYEPNINLCRNCKSHDLSKLKTINILDLNIYCIDCKEKIDNSYNFEINNSVYMAMRYVFDTEDKSIFNFSLKNDSKNLFIKLCDKLWNRIIN